MFESSRNQERIGSFRSHLDKDVMVFSKLCCKTAEPMLSANHEG